MIISQYLKSMINYAANHPHLQCEMTEKLHAHYETALKEANASTITMNEFYALLITPIIWIAEEYHAKKDKDGSCDDLEKTISDLSLYKPSIVELFEKASILSINKGCWSNITIHDGMCADSFDLDSNWNDMTYHEGMCAAIFTMLNVLDKSDMESMKRVISIHFNQYTQFDLNDGTAKDMLLSYEELMNSVDTYTSQPEELEPHIINELFKTINSFNMDAFAAHTEIEQHVRLYALAKNNFALTHETPYSNADATLNILKASIIVSGNFIHDEQQFAKFLSDVLKDASREYVDSFIDFLVASTWNTTNSKMYDDVELLQSFLSSPVDKPFTLSQDQSERILSNIEHVMNTSQTYGYENVSSDATTDDLIRVFKSRIEFLNAFITQGSDPEMDVRVLEIMNREHAIAFRDGLLNITFDPSWSKDENWSGFLADIQQTLDVIHQANKSVSMDDGMGNDPLTQDSRHPSLVNNLSN